MLAESTDPAVIGEKYEQQFATDPWYIHLYRTSHAYHGVHPFYMWYWAAHAMDHVDDVIWVGANRRVAARLGFRAATTLADALEMASDTVGTSPSITYLHNPPHLLADVDAVRRVHREEASRTSAGRPRLALGSAAAGAALGRAVGAAGGELGVPHRVGAPRRRAARPARWPRRRAWSRSSAPRSAPRSRASTSSSGSRGRSSSWATTPPTSTRPLVLLSLPDEWRRRTAVAAAADYFFDTWWRAVGSALLFNTFPIERRSGSMSDTPGDVLADGWSLLIFPEGTRSADGWVGRFRMGAAYLACEHGVPVVPVAHRGTFAAMPRGQGWPSPGRRLLTIRFGEPLVPGPDETPRSLAPRIRDAVAGLLDEDSSTWWEARRRAAARETPGPQRPGRRAVAAGVGADRLARHRPRPVPARRLASLNLSRSGPIRLSVGSEPGVTRATPARASGRGRADV